jgi:membrane associated rhomboid family serine protease
MILPYSTDAPIYHWPFATVAMIILNSLLLFVSPLAAEAGYALDLGEGLHPLQWLTHNFLHAGIMHLVGNMLFLWVFGIIVEGKIGAIKFLLIYVLLGILHGASIQTICLHVEPTKALGASSIIFGLMSICMIWAPKNDLQCLVFIGFGLRGYGDVWDIPIVAFALFEVGWELFDAGFWGMAGFGFVGSAMLHLSGAFWGVPIGIGMLKLGWVDCENWDIFAVMAGRQGKAKSDKLTSRSRPVVFESEAKEARPKASSAGQWEKTPETRAAESTRKIQKQLEVGDPDSVREAYRKARTNPAFEPAEQDLLAWIKELHAREAWKASIPLMRDFLHRFPAKSGRVRIRLAQILVKVQRPTQALREIEQLPNGALNGSLDAAKLQVERQARQLIEDGVLELEGDD